MEKGAVAQSQEKGTGAVSPEKWEIFAWAVRDVMLKASGLERIDCNLREKLRYEEILGYRKAEVPSEKV